jgi:hypothetical protein
MTQPQLKTDAEDGQPLLQSKQDTQTQSKVHTEQKHYLPSEKFQNSIIQNQGYSINR